MQGMVGRPGCSPIMNPSALPLRGQIWDRKALGHVVVFGSPWQTPEGTRREAALTLRGLLHPDMMCLTKAGKGERNQSPHLAPLSPTSNLPTTLSPDSDSFSYLGLLGRSWKKRPNLCCILS